MSLQIHRKNWKRGNNRLNTYTLYAFMNIKQNINKQMLKLRGFNSVSVSK